MLVALVDLTKLGEVNSVAVTKHANFDVDGLAAFRFLVFCHLDFVPLVVN
jgi:hypothetical protein